MLKFCGRKLKQGVKKEKGKFAAVAENCKEEHNTFGNVVLRTVVFLNGKSPFFPECLFPNKHITLKSGNKFSCQ
jgi:hypothetical protein